MSRPENRENLQSLADQFVWAVQTYIGGGVQSIPQTIGTLYYVSDTDGDDANTGLSPDEAKATIKDAIDTCSAGDIIIIEAGTYDENGLELDKNAVELWCEVGVVISDTTGGAQTLLVSANNCRIDRLTIVQAGQIGLKVTGTGSRFYEITSTIPTIGFDIDGSSNEFIRCVSGSHTVAGFDISDSTNWLVDCWSKGAGGNTYGYHLSGTDADGNLLDNCVSAGNATSGFTVNTGNTLNIFKDCTSGAGDGKRVTDFDDNVWDDYSFDNLITYDTEFSGVATTYNMFKVTGSVEVFSIYGDVQTVIPNTSSSPWLSIYSANDEVDITKEVAAPDIDSAPVGSLLFRLGEVTDTLLFENGAIPSVEEATSKRFDSPLIINADSAADTYIRLNLSAALASGKYIGI